MKKEILTMYVILALLVSINGCIEKTPPEKGLYIFYVGGTWADYARIQDAIDNASDGYSIFVFDGTYYETLVINKSVNLISKDKDKSIICCNESERYGYKDIICIAADNCTVAGFKIVSKVFH